jgi:hypothetical protein
MATKEKETSKRVRPSSKSSSAPIQLSKEFITASDDSGPGEDEADEVDEESDVAESEAEAEENEPEALVDATSQQPLLQEETIFSTASEIRPAPPYTPPIGFYYLPVPKSANSLAKQIKGKELWHIALAAGTPIEQLNGVSWDKLVKGEAVIETDTSQFNLSFMDDDQNKDLRVMAPSGSGYKSIGSRIQKSVFMKQFSKLEHVHINVPKRAPLHVQPKGLRMRYRTTGSGFDYDGGAIGDSESDAPAKKKRKTEEKLVVDRSEKVKRSDGKMEVVSRSKKVSSSSHDKKDKVSEKKEKRKEKKSSDDKKDIKVKKQKDEDISKDKHHKEKKEKRDKAKDKDKDKDGDKEKRKKDRKEKKVKIET